MPPGASGTCVRNGDERLQHPRGLAGIYGGGGAVVTPVGERVVGLYRAIETHARAATGGDFRAIGKLIRHDKHAG